MQSTQLGVTGEGRVTLHFLTTGHIVLIIVAINLVIIITTGDVVLIIDAINLELFEQCPY